MKKAKDTDADTMRDEYHFDYSKAEWGKFAGRVNRSGAKVVTIDAEVAEVFPDSVSVNDALRKFIAISELTAPKKTTPRKRRTGKGTAKSIRATVA